MRRRSWCVLALTLALGAPLAIAPAATAAAPAPSIVRVPQDAPTIQDAVDTAAPGTLILVSPGVYREQVLVTTPNLVIRGLDRNRTILDGRFRRTTAIHIRGAGGVAIENLTARNYLIDGFFWEDVDGYRGSYLTAYRIGGYGLYASRAQHGQLDHSYVSGAGDSGFYVGACNQCHALVVDDVAEHNAVGFSGTNASGDVAVVRSQWRDNGVGIAPNSLDTEPRAPQDGMTIAGNLVADSSDRSAPRSGEFGGLTGTGIALVGVLDDVVVNNRVEGSAASGIVVTPNPGIESRVRAAQRNRVEGNVVVHSASHDLVWADANATDANCFARNTFRTSAPRAIERAAPCAGAATAKLTRGALSSARVFARPEHRPRRKPRQTPAPAPQPDMPDAATAPARPATAEPSIAVDPAQLPVPASRG